MGNRFVPLSVPNLKGNELKYVSEAIEAEWVSTGGAFIEELEKKIAEYVGAPGAVACQSGTSGIHLALLSRGISSGDEVIVPTLTFVAAVNPVIYCGAEPVFMDCDDSLCMDMEKVEKFCDEECSFNDGVLIDKTTGKRVKALIVVHVFGNMADMERASMIAEKYGLTLIEDATEALGSCFTEGPFKNRFAGTIGDVGVYSFNGNKIITTGGGGMIVSNDTATLDMCKYLSTQAKDDPLYYDHGAIGYNYRMTNVQAAIGLAQLEQLESFIEIKRVNYESYQAKGVDLLPFRNDIRSNCWFYSFITDHRDEIIKKLSERKIQTRPVWNLIHSLKPYSAYRAYDIQNAVYYQNSIVNLPCSTNLSSDDLQYVVDNLKNVLMEIDNGNQ